MKIYPGGSVRHGSWVPLPFGRRQVGIAWSTFRLVGTVNRWLAGVVTKIIGEHHARN